MNSKDKIITLINFHAKWCSPCQTMESIVTRIETEFESSLQILKVDVDDFPKFAQHFNVQNVPTFVLIKDEKTLWKRSGILTFAEMNKLINDAF